MIFPKQCAKTRCQFSLQIIETQCTTHKILTHSKVHRLERIHQQMLLQTGGCALTTRMPDPRLRHVTPWSSHGLVVGLFPEIHLVITGEPEGKLRSQKVAGSSTTSLQKSLLAPSLGTRCYHLQSKALPLVCELGTGGVLWFRRGSKKSMEDKLCIEEVTLDYISG